MLSRFSLLICALLFLSTGAQARTNPSTLGQARDFPAPPVRARAALVMDATNGAVLAGVNFHLQVPIASTTKIMTALVALQLGHLTDRIRVPKQAFDYEWDATVMGLKPGQVVTLRDLLYGLMLPSGADAANVIAIHYGGSEARFVALMNREAVTLGLRDTHYMNAHGLTAPHAVSSAYDLAVLGQYVSYIPDLMKITAAHTYQWNGHTLTNVNHVLFWYPGIDGIKPGYTNEAGLCQVLDVHRDGRHIVVVTLHTPDLVVDARNLLNFGLQDFAWIQSALPNDRPSAVQSGTDNGGAFEYFPASGHYVRGKLLRAYARNGGLLALGFPRTELIADGKRRVQYFQNGALALDTVKGSVSRLALGLTVVPTPVASRTPTLSPTPKPSPTVAPPPPEATIILPGPTATKPTSTPRSKPQVTPTPRPLPKLSLTPVATVAPRPIAAVFVPFQKKHTALLGAPAGSSRQVHGYTVQIFAYGGLIYDPKTRALLLLPLGDRLLGARAFLPDHPGNVYPAGFAPPAMLKAIGWTPSSAQS